MRPAGTDGASFSDVELVVKSYGRSRGDVGVVLDYTTNPVGNSFVYVLTAKGGDVWYTQKIDVLTVKKQIDEDK